MELSLSERAVLQAHWILQEKDRFALFFSFCSLRAWAPINCLSGDSIHPSIHFGEQTPSLRLAIPKVGNRPLLYAVGAAGT